MTKLISISLLLVGLVCAEDAPKSAPEPQITTEQQLEYRSAQVNLYIIKEQNVERESQALKVLQGHIDAMAKICGDRGLVANSKGNPDCGKVKAK